MSETPGYRYDAHAAARIEKSWQKRWLEQGAFNADNPAGDLAGPLAKHPSFFLLDMFPYPSGKGLHVGHPLGYIATDVVARYHRMKGENVLYTMGFDAFGLPAEQYAVATGQHPAVTTKQNISNMRTQLARIGLSHDMRRVFSTTDPDYVKWTQWCFIQIYNSWYDPDAPHRDGSTGTARPIAELVDEFASGRRAVPGGGDWATMDAAARERVLADYRLAYVSHAPVNWCPGLGTVLADEEVTNEGRSERGNYPVFNSKLRQWMMRMTAYADRLAADLDLVDWPDKVRTMQRNWIGKSTGASVTFTVPAGDGREEHALEVFTTRADTLFGATFMVIAPEHPLVGPAGASEAELAVPATWPEGTRAAWTGGYDNPRQALAAFRAKVAKASDKQRTEDAGTKEGVFTGLYGINPVNGAKTPIFAGNYVLMGYGTGAIMAVPAHDQRDWDFAKEYDLDIIQTITPGPEWDGQSAWVGDGVIQNSANDQISLNGMGKAQAIDTITAWLESRGAGRKTVTYRLRDWLFSRQRFWGEPFPVVHGADGRVHVLPESSLPITLPEVEDFSPRTFDPDDASSSPESPLARATDWVEVRMDLGEGEQTYYRDTNTMPNWAGSCYYEIRYLDPNQDQQLVEGENETYWMGPNATKPGGGADLYVGGVEHAVLHLLYARFWQKVLYDLGHVSACEPFHHLFNQGMIEAYAYTDSRGQYVPADEVSGSEEDGFTWNGQSVNREYGKMGKSLKNIVTPDAMCDTYGADTFRLYEMSMGPLDMSRPWETRAVVGSQRFLQRLWRNVVDEETGQITITEDLPDRATQKLVAQTIAAVTEEYEAMRINTAIAKMIVLNNHLVSLQAVPRSAIEPLVLMVAPVAPHIAEELWELLGHSGTLVRAPFPQVADPTLLVEEQVTCVVQVNGKVKYRLEVSPEVAEDQLAAAALATPPVQKALAGREPIKTIVRAPKLVNVVIPK